MKKTKLLATSFLLGTILLSGVVVSVSLENNKTNQNAFASADNYYDNIDINLKGGALLGALHDLTVTKHTTYTTYNDCQDAEKVYLTDGVPDDPNSVYEFYSGEKIAKAWGGGAQGTWNREHVWCQSQTMQTGGTKLWGETGGGADLHHIRPVEAGLNSARNNNPYGIVTSHTLTTEKNYEDASNVKVALGGWLNNNIFEPIDCVKGDVARILFYLYMHYNSYTESCFDGHATTNGTGKANYFGSLDINNIVTITGSDYTDAFGLLLSWNALDPVSPMETRRNDAVQAIEGCRNPFIDNTSYARAIWGGESINTEATLSIVPNTFDLPVGEIKVFTSVVENLASNDVTWEILPTTIAKINSYTATTATVEGLAEGVATLTAKSSIDTSIIATATINVTAQGGGGSTSIVITRSSFASTSNYGTEDVWTCVEISGKCDVTNNPNCMQIASGSISNFYNTTPIEGNIVSVEMKLFEISSNNPTFKGYFSSSPLTASDFSTSGTLGFSMTLTDINPKLAVVSPPGNYQYFYIYNSTKNATYVDSVTINFTLPGVITPMVTGVSLSPSGEVIKHVGETQTFIATVSGEGDFDNSVSWLLLNPSVSNVASLTVTSDGAIVTANNVGSVTVQVTTNGSPQKTASTLFKVVENDEVIEVIINEGDVTLTVGESKQFSATVNGTGNFDQQVTWSIEANPSGCASISESGFVSTSDGGSAIITAKSVSSPNKFATVNLLINPASSGGDPTPLNKVSKVAREVPTLRNEMKEGEYYISAPAPDTDTVNSNYYLKATSTFGSTIGGTGIEKNNDVARTLDELATNEYFVIKQVEETSNYTIQANETTYLGCNNSTNIITKSVVDDDSKFTFNVAQSYKNDNPNAVFPKTIGAFGRGILFHKATNLTFGMYKESNATNASFSGVFFYEHAYAYDLLIEKLQNVTCDLMKSKVYNDRINYLYSKLNYEEKQYLSNANVMVDKNWNVKDLFDYCNTIYQIKGEGNIQLALFDDTFKSNNIIVVVSVFSIGLLSLGAIYYRNVNRKEKRKLTK